MPRLLRVITRLNVGGPSRHVLLLNQGMVKHHFDSRLIHGKATEEEGSLDAGSVPSKYLEQLKRPISPWNDLRAARFLAKQIRDFRPDVVHTHMAKAGVLGRWVAHRNHVPVIVHTYHGHVLDAYFSKPVEHAFLQIERRLARLTTALITISPSIRDDLLERGIGTAEQWHVVPLGLDLDQFRELPSREAAEAKLGLSPGLKVGIVGRLTAIKDVGMFLDAARIALSERPDLSFVVAGDGESRGALEEQGRRGLGSRVRFLGWTSDLQSLYQALDVVALTSLNEGTPASLIEASAAGRAIVATSVGGVSDVVAANETGLLVPPRSPTALARAILTYASDPELRELHGRAAREKAFHGFSQEKLVSRMSDLYWSLLQHQGPNDPAGGRSSSRPLGP